MVTVMAVYDPTCGNVVSKVVAATAGVMVTVLAFAGGAMMLFTERTLRDSGMLFNAEFEFFALMGLGGTALVWAACFLVIAVMFFCPRRWLAAVVALAIGLLGGAYFGLMFLSSVAVWLSWRRSARPGSGSSSG